MRLAWFTHRYYPCIGGSEHFARAMVSRFVNQRHEVDVFTSDALDLWYFTNKQRARVDRPPREWIDGARIQRFRVRHFPGQRYVGRLLSYLPNWHVQCCHESYMPILPGIDRVRGPYDAVVAVGFPYTVFAHAAWKTALAAHAPLILIPFLHLSTPGDAVNRHYTRPHQARLLREADTVVVQTDIEAAAVLDWGVSAESILKLGMAVDTAAVTGGDRPGFRKRLGIDPGARVLGQLGANDPNKGTCDLVSAVERINAQRNERELVHLVLAGAPSPDFERFLATISPTCARWLHVLGFLPEQDRASFYAALDVFAMPSRTDSFGIVFLEAWANRLPVVAAAAGGVAEVVRHNQDGLLVPFGDVAALSSALERLITTGELATRLGNEGQRRVSAQGYTWQSRHAVLSEWITRRVALRRSQSAGALRGRFELRGPHQRVSRRQDPTAARPSGVPRN